MRTLAKRILSMILLLCMSLTILPVQVMAVTKYDPDAAVAYASLHATDTPEIAGADCANFVSKCVTAGGIRVSERVCHNLMVALQPYAAEVANLKITVSGGYGRVPTGGSNANVLSKGDVMFVCCERCRQTGNNYERHAVIFSGDSDSNGYARCYAHTSMANNTTFWVGYDGKYACSNGHSISYISAEVVHFAANDLESHRPGKPSLLDFSDKYVENKEIIFKWNETPNTTHYNVYLDVKNDQGAWERREVMFYAESGFVRTLPEGEYRVILQSTNSNYYESDGSNWLYMDGDPVYFTVAKANMWCEGVNMPDELIAGKDFALTGNICGNNGVKWYALVIYNSENQDIQNVDESVWQVTSTNCYSINTLAESLDFASLSPGKYRLSIQSMDNDDGYFGAYSKEFLVKCNTHRYQDTITAPTCTEQGYTTHTCKDCGNSYKDTYTAALGHSYSYKVTKEPTVSAAGTLTGTCSKCSGSTTVTLPKLSTTDYTYSVIKESSYTEAGTGRYTWKTTTYGTFHFDVTLDKLAAELTRIEIASNPTKTVYQIGETLDTTGLCLKATYSDGSAKTITGGFTTSGFDSSSAGEKTVTVSFNGKTAAFTVTVVKAEEADPNAPQITLSSKSAISGQTITVEITAANMPSVKSLMLENFRYDSQILEFVGAELNLKGALIADWDSKNMIATVAFAENTDINGVIMTLTFRVKADAEGECPIACDVYANQLQTGGSETQVKLTVVPGTVTVMTYARGDVNGDGYVNSDDAIYLLRYTLSPSRYPINQNGDMNGDGYVNSDDAIYLLRHTLSPVRYPLN